MLYYLECTVYYKQSTSSIQTMLRKAVFKNLRDNHPRTLVHLKTDSKNISTTVRPWHFLIYCMNICLEYCATTQNQQKRN